MKTTSAFLSAQETTIFTTMSELAVQHGAINLGQGFPDTEGPREVVEAAQRFLGDGRNQYAPLRGVPELRRAVADAARGMHGLEIDPDREVVVTAGATEALFVSLAALLDPGDEVVVIEPLYDTYLPAIRLLGAVARPVRLHPPDWRLTPETLRRAFGPRTKAILINSPMNPTGKVFTEAELDAVASIVLAHDAFAICDEVYEHLVFAPARHVPLMSRPGMRDRCIRIGSAGKTFSLTGWKIGYATASPRLASVIAAAHQNLVFAAAPNLQRAVAFGFGLGDVYVRELAASLAGRRTLLAAGLGRLGFDVLPADGTYFLTVDISRLAPDEDDASFCRRMVADRGVAMIPLSAFYASDPPRHLVRFAFCKQDHVLEDALARLASRLTAFSAAAPKPAELLGDRRSA